MKYVNRFYVILRLVHMQPTFAVSFLLLVAQQSLWVLDMIPMIISLMEIHRNKLSVFFLMINKKF